MNSANAKWFEVVPPQAIVNNASWTATEIDTLGYIYLEMVVDIGAIDIAMVALSLGESDTAGGGGSYTAITGAVFGTSTNSAGSTSSLPAATADNKLFVFNVDLKGRKRFIALTATGGSGSAGTYLSAMARLSRAFTAPTTAAGFGASQVLQVPAYP